MSGTGFQPADYGETVPGNQGLIANGTTPATGTLLTRKFSVFQTVAVGGIALLPTSYNSNTQLTVLNRTANSLNVVTTTDQIETYGTSVAVAPGGDATFTMIASSLQPHPNTWWLS